MSKEVNLNIGVTEKEVLPLMADLKSRTVQEICISLTMQHLESPDRYRFAVRRLYQRGYLTRTEHETAARNVSRYFYTLSCTGIDLCRKLGIA